MLDDGRPFVFFFLVWLVITTLAVRPPRSHWVMLRKVGNLGLALRAKDQGWYYHRDIGPVPAVFGAVSPRRARVLPVLVKPAVIVIAVIGPLFS
ncbi:hypothetical protein Micbo1qcDRAFT_164817, partial [Microdochium bolleyi]